MAAPVLLICVGAAKAGTSWLYRALHDREECALPAVKELHYWDTFEAEARDKQLAAFRARLVQFAESRAAAEVAGRGWQVRNMDRRMADMRDLMATLEADRAGDAGYRAFLEARAGQAALTADMTPGYALLEEARLTRMVALSPMVRILYLIRDPLARLWSHVRMQAERQREAHQPFDKKAQGILRRIVQASSREDALVLDFFAGSGTTGAVCAELGRRFVMIDDNPEAMAVRARRLAEVDGIERIGWQAESAAER